MDVYKKWKRKRQITTIIYYLQAFMLGIEYTSASVSGLYYFKNDIPSSNPKLFYGISMAALYVSAIIASPMLGKIMDQTRQLRAIILTIIMLNVLGNFIYTISLSPLFPILGRLLSGVADACIPVMSGM